MHGFRTNSHTRFAAESFTAQLDQDATIPGWFGFFHLARVVARNMMTFF